MALSPRFEHMVDACHLDVGEPPRAYHPVRAHHRLAEVAREDPLLQRWYQRIFGIFEVGQDETVVTAHREQGLRCFKCDPRIMGKGALRRFGR
jgi:hypothetical protein